MPLPCVHLIATGGTIAGLADGSSELVEYRAASLDSASLLAAVPEVHELARLRVGQPFSLDSRDMGPGHWLQLAREVRAALADPETAGVVITHGTDTLEESAFFLDRTTPPGKPVVMTCALRPASARSADGPLNLVHAIQLALSPCASNAGLLVVCNERIHAGSRLRKGHTRALHTFELGDPPIGRCDPPRLDRLPHEVPRCAELLDRPGELPRVDVLWVGAGSDPDLLAACVAHGARGVVLALPGNGSLPEAWRDAVGMALARGLPVVRASRCGRGPVDHRSTDGGGLLAAGELGPAQARVALMLALAAGRPAGHFFA